MAAIRRGKHMYTIISDGRKTSWLPKLWKPFWIGKQRFLFIFHLTRFAFGFNLDIGESAGSLNLHFGFFILKVSLFRRTDILRPKLKKMIKHIKKTGETPNLTSAFTIVSLRWDPNHLGLAIVFDPLDYQYNLNIHLLSFVLTIAIPVRPSFTAASRLTDIAYIESVLEDINE